MKAVFFKDYLSFDDNFPYAVQILNEDDTESKILVFSTKAEAIIFTDNYNKK